MMPNIKTTFKVGKKYKVEMTIAENGYLSCEWSPHFPKSLSKQEWHDYRKGRAILTAKLAEVMDGSIVVVEI